MKRSQSGFTLIELVVVIVLLAILGVTALGRFQDLSGNAEAAAVNGVASELSAAAAINYSAGIVTGTPNVTINSTAAATITVDGTADACDTTVLGNLFQNGTFPAGYQTAANTAANCATNGAGSTYNCTISRTGGGASTGTASLICTGG